MAYTSGSNVVTDSVGAYLALTPATITVTPVAPARTAAKSIVVTPATITVTPVAPARTVGGATRALSPATVTVTPVAPARTLGGTSRALTPATITITPVSPDIEAGASTDQTVALSPATITLTPSSLGVTVPSTETPTGGGYGAREDAVARHARLRRIIQDDDDLVLVLI